MDRKKLHRWIIRPSFILTILFLFHATYTFYIFLHHNALKPADAVLVFAGVSGRIEAGYKIVNEGYADYLIVSPASVERLAKLNKRFNLRRTVITILEDRAVSTFENALYTNKLVEDYNFGNVILVTSDYHMPRSYLILRLLVGPDVQIQRYSVYADGSESKWKRLFKGWRSLMSELVKQYGTLVQAAIFRLSNL